MISRSAFLKVADTQNAITYREDLKSIVESNKTQLVKNLKLADLMSRIEEETELPGLSGTRLEVYKQQYPKTYQVYLEVSNSRVF